MGFPKDHNSGGCDIHLFVEGYRTIGDDSKWVSLDTWKIYPNYSEDFDMDFCCKHIYSGRQYALFATLANVRNTCPPWKFISNPKGMPTNPCKMVKKMWSYCENMGCHDASWLTLHEIKKFCESTDEEIPLGNLILMLEKKKEKMCWLDGENDKQIRIVFWFDS